MNPHAFRLLFLLGMLVALDSHSASVSLESPSDLSQGPALGRIIVKYRDSVTVCVHCWHEHPQGKSLPTSDLSRSLDELHARYRVRSVAPLFRSATEEQGLGKGLPSVGALRDHHRGKLLAAQARFALRAQRAAPAAQLATAAPLPALHHVYVLELPQGVDQEAAAAAFRRDPHVEYAQTDGLLSTDFTPRDPYFGSSGSWRQAYPDLWALQENRLNMEEAWNLSRGRGVVVAVLDSGVDYNHPDIAANIWKNRGEIAGNGIDDDHNGFVDDVRGWSFVTCTEYGNGCLTPATPGSPPLDDNGHGTHVAGTIAAIPNNGRGIVGVAPKAQIMPVKSFNRQGAGLHSESAAGLVYAAMNGADVINNSWGCGFCPTVPVLADALKTVHGLGVVAVFAAGNSATDVRYRAPHNLHDPKPIVVAASDHEDEPAWFSSFGAAVDVAAPGAGKHSEDSSILSLRSGDCALCSRQGARPLLVGSQYLRLQGTSMAAPHVSGLAALLLARHPTLSNDEVRQILKASADDVHDAGYDLRTGAGRIDASRALTSGSPLEVKIDSPLDFTMAGEEELTVTGTAAGADFDRYQLFYWEEYGSAWQPITAPSTTEVRNGELGRWDLGGLPLGLKALRLQATTRGGLEFNDVIYVGKQLASKKLTRGARGVSSNPDISGDLVVWAGDSRLVRGRYYDQSEYRVYVRDLAKGTTKRISDTFYGNSSPRISGNLVVWTDGFIGRENAIYACSYDRATGACPTRKIHSGSSGRVVVSGSRIAFASSRPIANYPHSETYIKVYDLATGASRLILTPRYEGALDIEGDLVVSARYRENQGPNDPGNSEIMLYDLAKNTERKITSTPQLEAEPKIDGGRIVFERRTSQTTAAERATVDLILYDIATGKERVLVEGFPRGGLFSSPSPFSKNRVVWRRVSDVVMYDLEAGQTHAVAISPMSLRTGAGISGDRIVWADIADLVLETGEIYTALIP